MMYTLAYCYPEGQTVFENKYFWKVLLPELEQKWQNTFLLENDLDVLPKALKSKKTDSHQWRC